MTRDPALKDLARMEPTTAAFVSLYLDTRWASEKDRERVRIFVKSRLKAQARSGSEMEGLAEDAQKIESYVRGLVNREWDETAAGVAVFACARAGIYRVLRTRKPFQNFLGCGERPFLRQAAERDPASLPAVCALASADAGTLVEFSQGRQVRRFFFEDDTFPGRHERGGRSQARYRRHVEDHLQRNLIRLASELTRVVDEGNIRRVFLSGTEPVLAAFEGRLPPRVTRRVCGRLRLDPRAHEDQVRDEVLWALGQAVETADLEALDTLFDRYVGTPRGAVGLEAVAEAVRRGQVRELYLDRSYREKGWKCFGCGALGVRVPLGCSQCGGPVEGVELGEELVRGVLAADGEIIGVEDHPRLREAGGVAARLRYGRGKGLVSGERGTRNRSF